MVRIYKDFTFEAAHQLEGYEGGCANVHGHSYKLRVGLAGKQEMERGPNEGFLMDFSVLKARVKTLFLDRWDHSFLARGDEEILPALTECGNKVVILGFRPTAENMARFILELLHSDGLPVSSVVLYETETSCAEARVEDMAPLLLVPDRQESNMDSVLPISEIFGPTIQGEGLLIGKKSVFLRTYGCDDSCKWCDTDYTWNGDEKPKTMSIAAICDIIDGLTEDNGCRHVTITGGNPCIHGEAMGDLLIRLKNSGYSLALETQGTFAPKWLGALDSVTVSPKPPSSGNITTQKQLAEFIGELERFGVDYSVKIVVFDDEDYNYACEIYGEFKSQDSFFLQPGNPEGEFDLAGSIARYEALVKRALEDDNMPGVRILPQLHTWLWGNEREV